MRYRSPKKVFAIVIAFTTIVSLASAQTQQINIETDIAQPQGKLIPIWAYFGYDEPNYTYMKDGKKLLKEIAAFNKTPVFVRTHNLLTTGNGEAALKWGSTNVYTETADGTPVYQWNIVDSIFDVFVHNGMKPIAEIGFMPEALSTHPKPYRHYWQPGHPYEEIYTGWAYPPKDYAKWAAVVYNWVQHCVERYGKEEVQSWYWEVWNEPNISYWKGTKEEYFKLYDYAADAVKRACPGTRVGGPTSTGPGWNKANDFLSDFLTHCATGVNFATGKKGSPLDYITFHAKGSPSVVNGHVRMNMTTQLKDVEQGFATVAASAFNELPVIIGECDPEGCAACGMATNPENAYRNGTMYSSYTAASFTRLFELATRFKVHLQGAVSWSFEFENQRWFDGFRDLATNGVDKPVLNVFRMFNLLEDTRIKVENKNAFSLDTLMREGVHSDKADVNAFATAGEKSCAVMLWNYYDDDVFAQETKVLLTIKNIPAKKVWVEYYSIDSSNSNSYEAWQQMGSPQNVSAKQYALLEKAGKLQMAAQPLRMATSNGTLTLTIAMPRQAVSLVKLVYK